MKNFDAFHYNIYARIFYLSEALYNPKFREFEQ